jgi:hypothetical protein
MVNQLGLHYSCRFASERAPKQVVTYDILAEKSTNRAQTSQMIKTCLRNSCDVVAHGQLGVEVDARFAYDT